MPTLTTLVCPAVARHEQTLKTPPQPVVAVFAPQYFTEGAIKGVNAGPEKPRLPQSPLELEGVWKLL
jgi:hypothetical protein